MHQLPVQCLSLNRPPPYKPIILVAEDDYDGREMMELLLGIKGYSVLSAENGAEAIKIALANLPDLVLLDWELPQLNGLAVAKNLRTHSEFKKVPIIIVSGHEPFEHRRLAIEAGCNDYLLKPIDFDQLDTILGKIAPVTR